MQRDMRDIVVFELGSEEWAVLPDLGVPAILAKTDTGAKTSALHATRIEVYDAAGGRRVRFCVHPIAGRLDIFMACDAPLVAQRWVASSNGARELRCVVATRIQIGARAWPIEVTLTNRRAMRYRMLLGKRAMLDDMIVVPSRPSLQRVLGYGAYAVRDGALERGRARTSAGLRIGLLGEGPVGPFWQALADAALRRGHVVERIDVRRCSLVLAEGRPRIVVAGQPLPRLSCVIAAFAARADATTDGPHARSFALAVLRQTDECYVRHRASPCSAAPR